MVSKRIIRDVNGFEVTFEKDHFMTHAEAEADIEAWWEENASTVKGPRPKIGENETAREVRETRRRLHGSE